MKKKGAQIFVDSLIEHGVNTVFGFPGGVLLPIYDCLFDSKIRHILTRHEQGAIHAADAYARATGKVGICIATSGPGATNLVTGLANAFMDSSPVIAFTGQVPTKMLGIDSFQESDIYGISIPITKYNYLVKDVDNLKNVIDEAFYLALTGRPGPILIDLPKDVQINETSQWETKKSILPCYQQINKVNHKQIDLAADAINRAERPLCYIGGGVIISQAHELLFQLVKKANIPVCNTLMGKGAYPETDKLSLGMLGMHGTKYANYAVGETDLLIGIGARFDDRVTGNVERFATGAKIIHIDIDPAEIGKIIKVNIPIVGDAKDVLALLNTKIEKNDRAAWVAKIVELKSKYPLCYKKDTDEIKPQYVVEQIYDATGGDAIITTEVGQNQMWAAQYYKTSKPRTFITSGGLGTMGFGFPAAIGAKIACPDKIVFDIAGDGSFQMTIQELATAVQHKANIKVAILNNGYLGMVRQWQEMFFNSRYSQTDIGPSPDFVKIAQGYGAFGILVTKKEEVRSAIDEAISIDKPVVIDFHVSKLENVFPMVPPGGAINQMLDEESGK